MKKTKVLVTLIVTAVVVQGCSPRPSASERLSLSLKTNTTAKTEVDWLTSDQHPSRVFADLRDRAEDGSTQVSDETCAALKKYESDQSLVVFESEIRAANNKTLIAKCRDQLLTRLESIHAQRRAEMQNQGYAVLDFGRLGNLNRLDLQNPDSTQMILENVRATLNGKDLQLMKTEEQIRDVTKGYVAVRGDLQEKQVILSFDDGPNPLTTPMVAAALQTVGAKAIFFTMGKAAQRAPWVTQELSRSGHVLGNHSYNHPYMGPLEACRGEDCRKNWVSEKEAIFELQKTHQLLFDIAGGVEPFVRFPYGAKTKALGEFLKNNGLAEFFWSVDSEDWRLTLSNDEVLNRTLAQLEKDQRGIILMHDIHRRTAEILPELLRRLSDRGFSIVVLRSADSLARTQHPLIRGEGLVMPVVTETPVSVPRLGGLN